MLAERSTSSLPKSRKSSSSSIPRAGQHVQATQSRVIKKPEPVGLRTPLTGIKTTKSKRTSLLENVQKSVASKTLAIHATPSRSREDDLTLQEPSSQQVRDKFSSLCNTWSTTKTPNRGTPSKDLPPSLKLDQRFDSSLSLKSSPASTRISQRRLSLQQNFQGSGEYFAGKSCETPVSAHPFSIHEFSGNDDDDLLLSPAPRSVQKGNKGMDMKSEKSIIAIQAIVRSFVARNVYERMKKKVVIIQSAVRCMIVRVRFRMKVLEHERFAIVLGQGLAQKLDVTVHDEVTVVMATGSITPAGLVPRQRRFTVTGIVDSQSQLDAQFAYVALGVGQKLFRTGDTVHGIHLRVEDLFNTAEAEASLYAMELTPGMRVSNWQRNFGNTYQAIAVQKVTMFVLLSFLVAVAAFNLVSGLTMIVEQRSQDIAILRTMGASQGTLLACFGLLGLLLAVVGVSIGLLIGALVAIGLPGFYELINTNFELDLMSQYFISYLPVDVRASDLARIAGASLLLAAAAIIAPAVRAARAEPSTVLAHE